MKRLNIKLISAVTLALSLAASPLTFAQGPGPGNVSPAQHLERMSQRLNLTSSQQEQVLQILNETQSERESLHEQMETLRNETHNKIAEVLTEEQRADFESNRPGRRGGQSKPCQGRR